MIAKLIFIILCGGYLLVGIKTNTKLYFWYRDGILNQKMQTASDDWQKSIAFLPAEKRKRATTSLYVSGELFLLIVVAGIWYCSLAFNNVALSHYALTYLLLSIVSEIFSLTVWPTTWRPNVKLTKVNFTLSVIFDVSGYILLLIMIVTGTILL